MQAVRQLLAQRHLAVLICAAALLLKLLVPTGYMIDSSHGHLTVTICSGTTARTMTMAMPGMHGDMADDGETEGHGETGDHGEREMPCAFSGLSAAMTGAIDPIQLSALIAFVLSVGLTATLLPAPSRPRHLRPPLRGPPAHL